MEKLENYMLLEGETLDRLPEPAMVNGGLWLPGFGSKPCDIMFINESAGHDEVRFKSVERGLAWRLLSRELAGAGIDKRCCYYTNMVKNKVRGKVKVKDMGPGARLLQSEIEACNPTIIVPMGTNTIKAVLGKKYKMTDYRGALVPHPHRSNTIVIPTYHPGYILRVPDAKHAWSTDIALIGRVWRNEPAYKECPDYTVLNTLEEVAAIVEHYLSRLPAMAILDCEWHGENWMCSKRWVRTVQLGFMSPDERNFVVRLRDEEGNRVRPKEEWRRIIDQLRRLLTAKGMNLCGHHLRSDGHWLASYGIDIRENTVADTMVLEHTFDSRGPFNLDELTLKYTAYGRYDKKLTDWKKDNPDKVADGFGFVPDDILLPYGVLDVVAPKEILRKQKPQLKPYSKRRGKYPSLSEADVRLSTILYEPERIGLKLDRKAFDKIYTLYSRTLTDVETAVLNGARKHGMSDFNPRSVKDVRTLLFDKLEMIPIKTTKSAGGRPWSWVGDQDDDVQAATDAATDKDTLSILADTPGADPLVGLLRDFRKVDYVCRQWLVHEDIARNFGTQDRGGGLLAKLWPDGKLHASFSQMKETGRLGSSRPNVRVLDVLKPL